MHERIGMPSTSTVQLPQIPIPQLNFVPTMFSLSLSAQSSGMPGGMSKV
jgi:hypothetical protein